MFTVVPWSIGRLPGILHAAIAQRIFQQTASRQYIHPVALSRLRTSGPPVGKRRKSAPRGPSISEATGFSPIRPLPSCTGPDHDLSGAPKLLKVSVIGLPNAGKSTLVNTLLGKRVCSVSGKVHTTRRGTAAVLTEGSTQIVFLDTPGVVTEEKGRRHRLPLEMLKDPAKFSQEADIVAVVADASARWSKFELGEPVVKVLKSAVDKPSILILNKTDRVKHKAQLLFLARSLTDRVVDSIKQHDETVGGDLTSRSGKGRLFANMNSGERTRPLNSGERTRPFSNVGNREITRRLRAGSDTLHRGGRSDTNTPITADNTHVTADNTAVTTDNTPVAIDNTRVTADNTPVTADNERTDGIYRRQIVGKDKIGSRNGEIVCDEMEITEIGKAGESESINSEPAVVGLGKEWKTWREEEGKTWKGFSRVFMVSSLNADGTDDIKEYLLSRAAHRPWEYHSGQSTDQSTQEIILLCLREKLLDHLPADLPYKVSMDLLDWITNEDSVLLYCKVIVSDKRQASLVIGTKGVTLRKICEEAERDLSLTFNTKVILKVAVDMRRSAGR